jgi:hypothetical protein
LVVSALHFRAISAVIADAESVTKPSAMQTNASNTHPDFNLANMSSFSLPAANDTLPSASITGHCSQNAQFGTGEKSVFRAHGLD